MRYHGTVFIGQPHQEGRAHLGKKSLSTGLSCMRGYFYFQLHLILGIKSPTLILSLLPALSPEMAEYLEHILIYLSILRFHRTHLYT